MSYVDEVVKHNIKFTSLGADFGSELWKLTSDLFEDCNKKCEKADVSTKKKSRLLLLSLGMFIIKYKVTLTKLLEKTSNEMISDEDDWFNDYLSDELDVDFDIPGKLTDVLKEYPFASGYTLSNFAELITDKITDTYTGLVKASYATGKPLSELIQNESRFNTILNSVKNDSSSLIESVPNVYDRLVYTRNEKQIKKFVWVSILDTTTCTACGEMSGKTFDDISKVPLYPMHRFCRCTLIPFNDNIEEVIPTSYGQWFETQEDSVKREILGPARYELYKDGMKVTNFASNGHIFTLKELTKSKK